MTLVNYALVLQARRRLNEAAALTAEAIAIFEDCGDRRQIAIALGNLAEYCHELGRTGEASALIRRALAMNREFSRDLGIADNLWNLSRIQRSLGQPETALEAVLEAASVAGRLDLASRNGPIQTGLALVWQALSRYDRALDTYKCAVAWH